MAEKVGIRDVAREAGVSVASVSRALEPAKSHLLRDQTRQHVLEVCERLDYRQNVLARRFVKQTAETLTLIIPTRYFHEPRHLDFNTHNAALALERIQAMTEEALRHRYDIKLLPLFDPDDPQVVLAHLGYPHSDGVILMGSVLIGPLTETLDARGIPWAVTENHGPVPDHQLTVSVDPRPGIEAAVTHLVERGHERIALITPEPATDHAAVHARLHPWEQALKHHGCFDPDLLIVTPDEPTMRAWLDREAARLPFTAALCYNDALAARLIRELELRGKRVPDDVAVVGYDANPVFQQPPRPLTTVSVPNAEGGRLAVRILLKAIQGQTVERPDPLPTSFLPGATT